LLLFFVVQIFAVGVEAKAHKAGTDSHLLGASSTLGTSITGEATSGAPSSPNAHAAMGSYPPTGEATSGAPPSPNVAAMGFFPPSGEATSGAPPSPTRTGSTTISNVRSIVIQLLSVSQYIRECKFLIHAWFHHRPPVDPLFSLLQQHHVCGDPTKKCVLKFVSLTKILIHLFLSEMSRTNICLCLPEFVLLGVTRWRVFNTTN
jgi:hypothetical protein